MQQQDRWRQSWSHACGPTASDSMPITHWQVLYAVQLCPPRVVLVNVDWCWEKLVFQVAPMILMCIGQCKLLTCWRALVSRHNVNHMQHLPNGREMYGGALTTLKSYLPHLLIIVKIWLNFSCPLGGLLTGKYHYEDKDGSQPSGRFFGNDWAAAYRNRLEKLIKLIYRYIYRYIVG